MPMPVNAQKEAKHGQHQHIDEARHEDAIESGGTGYPRLLRDGGEAEQHSDKADTFSSIIEPIRKAALTAVAVLAFGLASLYGLTETAAAQTLAENSVHTEKVDVPPTSCVTRTSAGFVVAYDLKSPEPLVSSVSGSWIVEEAKPSINPLITFTSLSQWIAVGLGSGGGLFNQYEGGDTTLMQIYSESIYYKYGNRKVHRIGYEFLPDDPVILDTVKAGNTIKASISLVDGTKNEWRFEIEDIVAGTDSVDYRFSKTFTYNSSKKYAVFALEVPPALIAMESQPAGTWSAKFFDNSVTMAGVKGSIGRFEHVAMIMRPPPVAGTISTFVPHIWSDGSTFTVEHTTAEEK